MSKIVVYSCVTGKYDNLLNSILASTAIPEQDVSYVLFTNQLAPQKSYRASGSHIEWDIRELVWTHRICKRRTARWHKVGSHILFPAADTVAWFDGSQRLKPVEIHKQLILPSLRNHDIATFKHPIRTCVYREMQACASLKKDNEKLMGRQMAEYRKLGYPPFNGMVETACLLRRHSPEVIQFNKLWWEQIKNHSFRDQLSFNFAAWRLKLEYSRVPGSRDKSQYCDFIQHAGG
jgi:hypothetical protein